MRQRVFLLSSLALLLCLFVSYTGAYEEEERGELKRALDLLSRLQERGTECKTKGVGCKAVPLSRCCGTLQCYWPAGYSMRKDGHCVDCVLEGNACQRDSQCCADLQCDKGNVGWVDGKCKRYRRKGDCYRDDQCVNDCVKKWYAFHGHCT